MRAHLVLLALVLGCSRENATASDARAIVRSVSAIPEFAPRFQGARPITLHPRFGASSLVPLHVETADASFHLESVSPLDRDVRGERVDSAMVFRAVEENVDVVQVADANSVEELRIVRDDRAHRFTWKLRLGPAVAGIRLREGRVELTDAHGYVHLAAPPPFAIDARNERRELAFSLTTEGREAVLETTLEAGMAPPIVVDPLWSTVAPMAVARLDPAVIPLPSGKVIAIGGAATTTVEQYDPATNTWSTFASTAVQRTRGFAATLVTAGPLAGKILIAGAGSGSSSVELLDPTTKTSTAKASMTAPRSSLTLTALASGKVLAAGGNTGASNAEVYDPAANTWTVSTMTDRRFDANAVLLPSGKVLVAGGGDPPGGLLTVSTAELYDPATNAWTATAPMKTQRRQYPMFIASGKVWLVGGAINSGKPGNTFPSTAIETFDPATSAWASAGALTTPRSDEVAFALPTGEIVAAGGYVIGGSTPSTSATSEIFQPSTSTSKLLTSMSGTRANAGSAPLGGGRFLVVGGGPASSEVFAQAALGSACSLGADCASGYCVDGVCCAVASCDSAAGFSCNTPLKKGTACAKVSGAACAADGECDSSHCADGVCCNVACKGQCESCTVSTSVGTCVPVKGAPAAGHASCGAGGDVCSSASCDGVDTTKCHVPTTSTVCGVASCTLTGAGAVATDASHCDGAGKCLATSKSCGAYRCNGVVCATTCSDDTACFSGYYCDVPSKTCKPLEGLGTKCSGAAPCGPKLTCVDGVCCGTASCASGSSCGNPGHEGTCTKNAGSACTDSAECASGFCADGVCCNAKCDGQCEACDASGTCNAVTGAPHGARSACATSATDPCANAQCDGSDRTSCSGFSVSECRPASCTDGKVTARAVCDGKGKCPEAIVTSCSGFLCDEAATGCMSSCANDNQCAEGYSCSQGKCTNKTATCKDDGTRVDEGGAEQACAPYACRAGTCLVACGTTADCSGGAVCDPGSKTCANAETDAGGGCAVGSAPSPFAAGGAFAFLLVGLGLTRRTLRR